jgi:hypothetical protein
VRSEPIPTTTPLTRRREGRPFDPLSRSSTVAEVPIPRSYCGRVARLRLLTWNLERKKPTAPLAVAGATITPIGPLRVLGVCIPWHLSGTRFVEPKQKVWAQHHEFLDALEAALLQGAQFDVIAGDFNQLRPRRWGPLHAERRLHEALHGYRIVTEGPLPGCEREAGVDHVALRSGLRATEVFGWPHKIGDRRFSDHEGAGAVLVRADNA